MSYNFIGECVLGENSSIVSCVIPNAFSSIISTDIPNSPFIVMEPLPLSECKDIMLIQINFLRDIFSLPSVHMNTSCQEPKPTVTVSSICKFLIP